MSAGHEFPAPIGGTPLPNVDFAPSLFFAIISALLVPLMIYRSLHRRSRTIVLVGTTIFALERIVIFSLRALQARRESSRMSTGLVTYMQVSFALGFLSRGSDLVELLRCMVVNASYGSDTYAQSCAARTKLVGDTTYGVPPPNTPDKPKLRFWIRRFCEVMSLMFLIPLILGIVANSNYKGVIDSAKAARTTKVLRVVSVITALVFFVILALATVWAKWKVPRVTKRGTSLHLALCLQMITIAIYRLAVMGKTVTSLDGPSDLNTTSAKALFYVFHILPEFVFSGLMLGFNVRKTFGTGPWGDYKGHDETESMREKREARQQKSAEKRAATRGYREGLLQATPTVDAS